MQKYKIGQIDKQQLHGQISRHTNQNNYDNEIKLTMVIPMHIPLKKLLMILDNYKNDL